MELATKTFFSSRLYAVAGASNDKSKFGYKLLAWYDARHLPVQPVTPSRPSIQVSLNNYSTVSSVGELESPSETSLSIVTQPHITLKILREAKEAGISCVWMQPGTLNHDIPLMEILETDEQACSGSFDTEGLEYAKQEFKAAVGGNEERGGEGWCVLVDGDEANHRAKGDKL